VIYTKKVAFIVSKGSFHSFPAAAERALHKFFGVDSKIRVVKSQIRFDLVKNPNHYLIKSF
jgi:hypothetical protein